MCLAKERGMTTIEDMVKKSLPGEPMLSFGKRDIEKRIGFPAGRFTSPGPLLAPLLSAVLTVAFYGILAVNQANF